MFLEQPRGRLPQLDTGQMTKAIYGLEAARHLRLVVLSKHGQGRLGGDSFETSDHGGAIDGTDHFVVSSGILDSRVKARAGQVGHVGGCVR